MAKHRLIYLAALLGSCIFYLVYGQWLSWLILIAVAVLPWFSLAVSLPAMLLFHIAPEGRKILHMGEDADFLLLGRCRYPAPPFRGWLMLRSCQTGETISYADCRDAITTHCGGFTVTAEKVRIYDYLGLFSMPVWKKEGKTILVYPHPIPLSLPEDLRRQSSLRWKPKNGGFAENHELRLYRPGDPANQVHWKLSVKTGSLILREPVEPTRKDRWLTMNLRGTEEERDRKFGRLLWLGKRLLDQNMPFSLCCLTGNGTMNFCVSEESQLHSAMEQLLCQPVTTGDLRESLAQSPGQYHIGGAPDENGA